MFYKSGLENGLTPEEIDSITLNQWFSIAQASSSSPESIGLDLHALTPERAEQMGFRILNRDGGKQ